MNKNNEFRKYAVHHLGMSGNTIDGYAQGINDMTQYVIEERPGNFRAIDVFTRLISDRIIFLGMPILRSFFSWNHPILKKISSCTLTVPEAQFMPAWESMTR